MYMYVLTPPLLPQQTSKELKTKIIEHYFHSGCSLHITLEKIVN